MTIKQDAKVRVILADYAAMDGQGKLNVLGGNITFMQLLPHGFTTDCAIVVQVDVPSKYVGQDYSLTVELYDETAGSIVKVPGGPGGTLQAMRVQQMVHVQPVQLPGVKVPDDYFVGTAIVLNFANGLALPRGHSFDWRVEIDGRKNKLWDLRFHVLEQLGPPIFGGPAAPETIPGVGPFGLGVAVPQPGQGTGDDGETADEK